MSQTPMPPGGAGGGPSKIQHAQPGFGGQPGQGGQPRPTMPGPGSSPNPGAGAMPASSPPGSPSPGLPQPGRPLSRPSGPANGGMPGAVPAAAPAAPASQVTKIQSLATHRHHEERWKRTPNTTGTGAVHVKTFHCKLTEDALHFMDQAINEWLDAHPQYEVKFVTSSVGTFTGKLKEPALICQVWV